MQRKSPFVVSAVTFLLLMFSSRAVGYTKVDVSMEQLYAAAQDLYFAKVTAIEADKDRVLVAITKVIREGRKNATTAPPKELFAIQLGPVKELLKDVREGDPVVLFVGLKASALHVADTWLLAARPAPRIWDAVGRHDITTGFPGRTTALLQVVESLRNGKPMKGRSRDSFTAEQLKELGNPLLELFEHSNWAGKPQSLGKLGVQGTQIVAADVDGDKNADVLVVTKLGVRLFRGAGARNAVSEITKAWGLEGIDARCASFGDVNGDGKPDLLLDALWLNDGATFKQAAAPFRLPAGAILAVALWDVTGDNKADAICLSMDGVLSVFENPGHADRPWPAGRPRRLWTRSERPLAGHFGNFGVSGQPHVMVLFAEEPIRYALNDEGEPPAGYERLTGRKKEARYLPIKDYLASAAIDLNGGDGRMDVVVATKSGKPRDLVLMNRGYGAFWPNNEASLPRVNPAAMTAADMYGDGSWELLLLSGTGELFQMDSPPYKRGKPVE